MAEHWPGALLLWALGAAAAWYLLRDWPHVLWIAVLVPAWLWGESSESLEPNGIWWHDAAPAVGTVLLGITYLGAATHDRDAPWRRVLSRLGAVTLIPACILLAFASDWRRVGTIHAGGGVASREIIAWLVAWAVPFAAAWALGGRQALY